MATEIGTSTAQLGSAFGNTATLPGLGGFVCEIGDAQICGATVSERNDVKLALTTVGGLIRQGTGEPSILARATHSDIEVAPPGGRPLTETDFAASNSTWRPGINPAPV